MYFQRSHSKPWVILPNYEWVNNPTFNFLDQKSAYPKSTNHHFHNYTVNCYNGENSVQHKNHNRKHKRCMINSSDSSDQQYLFDISLRWILCLILTLFQTFLLQKCKIRTLKLKLINYVTFTCFTCCRNNSHNMFCDVNVFDVIRTFTHKNKMLTINKLSHGSPYNADIFFSFKDFLLSISSPNGSEKKLGRKSLKSLKFF